MVPAVTQAVQRLTAAAVACAQQVELCRHLLLIGYARVGWAGLRLAPWADAVDPADRDHVSADLIDHPVPADVQPAMRRPPGDRGRRPRILGEAVDRLEHLREPCRM